MPLNRSALKTRAKEITKTSRPSVITVDLVYLMLLPVYLPFDVK